MANDENIVPGTGHSQQTNIGAYLKRAVAFPAQSQTAAAGAGTTINGSAVNRCDPNVALSAVVAVPAHIVLASGHDVVVSTSIDHREDSSDPWTNYDGYVGEDQTITANADGSGQDVDLGFNVDLSGAKPEIRTNITPNFSASGVDTIILGGAYVFGGYDTNPAG